MDYALTTGHADFTVGGECSYDSGKGSLEKWALGAGYSAEDYQAGLILGEKGENAPLYFSKHWHCVVCLFRRSNQGSTAL